MFIALHTHLYVCYTESKQILLKRHLKYLNKTQEISVIEGNIDKKTSKFHKFIGFFVVFF